MLFIIGLLASGAIAATVSAVKRSQYAETRTKLDAVNGVLVQFVTRAGRLPCPADGTQSTGLEIRSPAGECLAQSVGVVPWTTLGIPEGEITDAWLTRFTYRVAPEVVQDNGMNFSGCDPAGVAPAVGVAPAHTCSISCVSVATCTPESAVVVNKGLTVNNAAGQSRASPAMSTGAAYVVISHGENKAGGFSGAGLQAVSSPPGVAEITNANNQVMQSAYIADDYNASAGNAHFDDLVIYKTVQFVVAQARLDARKHF